MDPTTSVPPMATMPTNSNQTKQKRKYTAAETFWFFVLMLVIISLMICIFQYSWNGSMTPIFGFRPITFVQALLVLIVARYLLPSANSTNIVIS
jgi:uncharacterized membrane protein